MGRQEEFRGVEASLRLNQGSNTSAICSEWSKTIHRLTVSICRARRGFKQQDRMAVSAPKSSYRFLNASRRVIALPARAPFEARRTSFRPITHSKPHIVIFWFGGRPVACVLSLTAMMRSGGLVRTRSLAESLD